MKVITRNELANRTNGELAALFGKVSRALAHTKPASPERSACLASLENISRERAERYAKLE